MAEESLAYEELRRALYGLHAYDTGSVDSGIHDPDLRRRAFGTIKALPAPEAHALMARLTFDLWLTPDALAVGYTLEDVGEWVEWLTENRLIP